MNNRTASKWFAACIAALSLTMVSSVGAADAKPSSGGDTVSVKRDSGWNRP